MQGRMLVMKKYMVILLVALIIGLGGWFAWSKMVMAKTVESRTEKTSIFSEPRPVSLETIGITTVSKNRKYPGVISANKEALLAFRVAGPLNEINVQLGDVVSKGQTLAQIDSRDFRDSIRVLEAELSGARGALKNAQQEFQRSKNLLKEKVIAQSEYDRAMKDVTTSEASVKNIKAQLSIAKHQLEDTKLKAPFDGIVSTRKVENHEMVAAGQVVMGLLDVSDLEVTANIPESTLAQGNLEEGMTVMVSFPSIPDLEIKANLKEWSSQPDMATKTYSVTFLFPAPEKVKLLPGMTAEIKWSDRIVTEEELTIPLRAVVPGTENRSRVWVYDAESKSIRSREVLLGDIKADDRLPVLEGLNSGERILVAGVDFVTEGMKVTPMDR